MKKFKKEFKNLLSNLAFTLVIALMCLAMESPFLLALLPDKKEVLIISLILTTLMSIFMSYSVLSSGNGDNTKL